MKVEIPKLKFHDRSCFTCRYYRQQRKNDFTDCLLLGRGLSMSKDSWHDRARVCVGWKRRPKNWDYICDENPFWKDKYISRKTQKNLRRRQ